MQTNVLYYGDNLEILRNHVPDESIDLIYLDPPFNSKADYNVLFREEGGERSAAQIKAFSDSWHWDNAAEETYREIIETCPDRVATMVSALRRGIGSNDVMAYLVMMTLRLVELRRVLKPTGSLYLHCDPTVSHYLKVVMDAVFSPRNFTNEISWKRTTTKSDFREGATNWPRIHDILLYYQKNASVRARFDQPFAPYSERYVQSKYRYRDPDGRAYMLDKLTAPGFGSRGHPQYEFLGVTRHWVYARAKMEELLKTGRIVQPSPGTVPRYKRYLDEVRGVAIGDTWDDIYPINSMAHERLGYPTQKPLALLERIIQASSNEGDVLLDPFCGCGTAIVAAEKLARKWIGIDITHLAITVMKERLRDTFGDITFEVIGEPKDLESARALATQDRYQFQWWALSLINARPTTDERKKGADTGIDGVIGFVEENGKAARVIVSVKSGGVNVGQVRDLKGVVEREKAVMGLFITLEPPTQPMRTEAVSAGFYHSALWGKDYPRIQILPVEELLAGRQPLLPPSASAGFTKARRLAKVEGTQEGLI
jgi:DNA modification methylase